MALRRDVVLESILVHRRVCESDWTGRKRYIRCNERTAECSGRGLLRILLPGPDSWLASGEGADEESIIVGADTTILAGDGDGSAIPLIVTFCSSSRLALKAAKMAAEASSARWVCGSHVDSDSAIFCHFT